MAVYNGDAAFLPSQNLDPVRQEVNALTVNGVCSPAGEIDRQTSVQVFGTGFADVQGVRFGSQAAVSWTFVSPTEIDATAPAGLAPGAVDVTVTTAYGTSPAGVLDRFTYYLPPTLFASPGLPGGLQGLIDAAPAGSTLFVAAGTYTEQLTITKDVTLVGAGVGQAVLQAPATMAANPATGEAAVIDVAGGAHVILTGLTVTGPGPAGQYNVLNYGVFAGGNSDLILYQARVTQISDDPLSGVQSGVAVRIGAAFAGQVATATLCDVTLDNYQKGGVVVSGAGSFASIQMSQITGIGDTPLIAQNGIQVSSGATAAIYRDQISGHQYSGASGGANPFTGTQSCGVLLYDAGPGTVVGYCTPAGPDAPWGITANDVGIYTYAPATNADAAPRRS